MIGFALAHRLRGLLFFFPFALFPWYLLALGYLAHDTIKKQRERGLPNLAAVSTVILFILLSPQSWWDFAFLPQLQNSRYRNEFLVNAGGSGEHKLAVSLLQSGVSVDARDESGDTVLHAASAAGDTSLVRHLLDLGAPVNILDSSGNSALERALVFQKIEVAKLLKARGGVAIRGGEIQRSRALQDILKDASD